jgi:tetratricopeptide (TPR) repeat protein
MVWLGLRALARFDARPKHAPWQLRRRALARLRRARSLMVSGQRSAAVQPLLLASGAALLTDDSMLLARALEHHAELSWRNGRAEVAALQLGFAARVYARAGRVRRQALALACQGAMLLRAGQTAPARGVLARSRELAHRAGVRRLLGEVCHEQAIAEVSLGRFREALELLWQAERAGGSPQSKALRAERWWVLGRGWWLRGRLERAEHALGRAFLGFRGSERPVAAVLVLLELLGLYRQARARPHLRQCWERVQAVANEQGLASFVLRSLQAPCPGEDRPAAQIRQLEQLALHSAPEPVRDRGLNAIAPPGRARRARAGVGSAERGRSENLRRRAG